MKKHVQKMWLIHDTLFLDKNKAESLKDGKDVVKQVFVGLDIDEFFDPNGESAEFFGSWIFSDEKECQREVYEFNNY